MLCTHIEYEIRHLNHARAQAPACTQNKHTPPHTHTHTHTHTNATLENHHGMGSGLGRRMRMWVWARWPGFAFGRGGPALTFQAAVE